jgi:hypothetical protein
LLTSSLSPLFLPSIGGEGGWKPLISAEPALKHASA